MAEIKIAGKLVAGASDGILAGADSVKDDNLRMFQHDINKMAVGNGVFNVTEFTHGQTADVSEAAALVPTNLRRSGMVITYEVDNEEWETKQFTKGDASDANDWVDEDNWTNFGGGVENGDETVLNINNLLGNTTIYTLQTALAALQAFEVASGITYRKKGLVISYQVDENRIETKQFCGVDDSVTNFYPSSDYSLWKDFGGGEEITLSDEPSEGGHDAFSTGGAYDTLPAGMSCETDEETGVTTLALMNAAGEQIGDEVQFTGGGGGGGGSMDTTIVSIAFEHSIVYGAFGKTLAVNAAIRSVNTNDDTTNAIVRLELLNTKTGATVWMSDLGVGQASSQSLTDYSFPLDFTSLINAAGTYQYRLIATDDTGAIGRKLVNISAVDVTISSTQTLNYLASQVITPTTTRNISMYRFANYASRSGILVTAEIYKNGAWAPLASTTVFDSLSHSIAINAATLGLTHGSYPVRIYGKDVASNVVGNTIYTSIMCIDERSTTPVVAIRYVDRDDGKVALYDTVTVDAAVYDPASTSANLDMLVDGNVKSGVVASRNRTYQITVQVTDKASDGTENITFQARSGASVSNQITLQVYGSVIDAAILQGAIYNFNFANRSNSESNHAITDHGYTITPVGANWRTNGFVSYLGEMAFRVAENMTATLNHKPYGAGVTDLKSTGGVLQFKFATNNVIDDDAVFMQCYDSATGVGFKITGKKIGIYLPNAPQGNKYEERNYNTGEKITVAIVVEPLTEYVTRGGVSYSFVRLYLNGEEVAVLGYNPSTTLTQDSYVTFNGTYGDFYIYYMMAWTDWMDWTQGFKNYLVKLSDSAAMAAEFVEGWGVGEDLLIETQTIQEWDDGGGRAELRPQADALYNRGVAYVVHYLDDYSVRDTSASTSDNVYAKLLYRNPKRPYQNFKGNDVRERNQGTTSSQRPVKNDRNYFAQKRGSTYDKTTKTGGTFLSITEPDFSTPQGLFAYELASINKIQIGDDTIPIDVVTTKVDYSDSGGANDSGTCNLMNATFRALGSQYMTPAQRAYTGNYSYKTKQFILLNSITEVSSTGNSVTENGFTKTIWSGTYQGNSIYFVYDLDVDGNTQIETKTNSVICYITNASGAAVKVSKTKSGLKMNHSTANHPIAVYRSTDATMNTVYFHAKGNWKEDKSEQVALGFKDTPGYNLGCLNYGDDAFVEYFGTRGETLDQIETRFRADNTVDTSKKYLLSLYCGRDFRFMTYEGGAWTDTTGSMYQNQDGTWTVEGDVLNPVDGFELLVYVGFCWFQGVGSIDDMMLPTLQHSKWVGELVSDEVYVPMWTYYFEPMVDDDQLVLDYLNGKKVPYNLYQWLRHCNNCDPEGMAPSTAYQNWRNETWKYANVRANMAYLAFTDYCAAVDQRAKNMQPMWFLDEGYKIVKGKFYTNSGTKVDYGVRMYPNKVYDCDTCNSKDNEGGCTVDAEEDPTNFTSSSAYAGYNSILFKDIYNQPEMVENAAGDLVTVYTVVATMRSATTTVDGEAVIPFSPEGATKFYLTDILRKWQKTVSSYDGNRKYIRYTPTSNLIYWYALQGLGLTALPAFIKTRWLYRDGYFRTGDFSNGEFCFTSRIAYNETTNDATIPVIAAKEGYFGVGNDSQGNVSESSYLSADSVYVFGENSVSFRKGTGTMFYMYMASRLSKVDFSQLKLGSSADFDAFTLIEELILGGSGHAALEALSWTYGDLTTLTLSKSPFLQKLNIVETLISTVDLSLCPRLAHFYATGSRLTRFTLAESSPINDISVPDTMVVYDLEGLPQLQYNGMGTSGSTGLRVPANGLVNVTTLRVEACSKFNGVQFLKDILVSQTGRTWAQLVASSNTLNITFKYLRIADTAMKGDGEELLVLTRVSGLQGLDDSGEIFTRCPIIDCPASAPYQMTTMLDDAEISTIERVFQEFLNIMFSIEAYMEIVDWFNGDEEYGGDTSIATPTVNNIDTLAFHYFNQETLAQNQAQQGYDDAAVSTYIGLTYNEIVNTYGQTDLVAM